MAVKGTCSVTIFTNKEIQAVWRYYLLRSATLSTPTIDDITVRPPTTSGVEWSDTEPSYSEGSTAYLYTVECTVYSDETMSYSSISKSSSYEAAKAAYAKAQAAKEAAESVNSKLDANTEDIYNTIDSVNDSLSTDINNSFGDLKSQLDESTGSLEENIDELRAKNLIELGNVVVDQEFKTIKFVNNTNNDCYVLITADGIALVKGNSYAEVTGDKIHLVAGGTDGIPREVATIEVDDKGRGIMKAYNTTVETLRMRAQGGSNQGKLSWVMNGSNGHLSLKEVL